MPATIIDDLAECGQCGVQTSDTRSVDGVEVCAACASEHRVCVACGRCVRNTFETVHGSDICAGCARSYFYRCDRCDLLADTTRITSDGTELCDSCAADYWDCDDCGELIDSGDRCESCQESYDETYADGLVYDCSYKPVPDFQGEGPVFLGVELEINTPYGALRECAEVATNHLGHLGYLKEDGSIDYGFEIVTHPMSYEWALDYFPWGMLADLQQDGCSADGNGLHVHISRTGFGSCAHVYRWMQFLNRNSGRVTRLARRVSNQWAAFSDSDRKYVKDFAKGAKGARYRAINTQNDHTFELRVFASSLNPREVKAALGLAAASVEYTRYLSVSDVVLHSGWEWAAFAEWLQTQSQYAPLAQEMEALACVS